MAMEESWSVVRVDGMVHATFWVAEWPRVEVRSDFLAPLLLGSARSTFAVVMEPLGPDAAVRKVEASRTADLADAELRRRGGFVSTARHARESEVLARREAELAEGHASFRYSGYRHRVGAERGGAGCGLRRRAARGGSEPARAPPPLRRPGRRLHVHPAAAAAGCAEGRPTAPSASTMTRWLHAPAPDPRERRRRDGRSGAQRGGAAARQPQPAHARELRRRPSSTRPISTVSPASRRSGFTSHVTGSLPCMPARHDILCGSLDFLWRPWGSIEIWEEPDHGSSCDGPG